MIGLITDSVSAGAMFWMVQLQNLEKLLIEMDHMKRRVVT